MIAQLIHWSIAQRPIVLLATVIFAGWGIWALRTTAVDALPDLSDVQVIIRTSYSGQAPQIVENQVTYPLTTTMLAVPGAKTVRGFSLYGDSFVYILFADGTDVYWARSRVLEYLSQIQSQLPAGAKPQLGPDATGVGWIYEYALIDRTGRHDLAQLRALQDWFLKYELKTVPDVAEIASLGGMVKQYQVIVDPYKLQYYNITLEQVITALQQANRETGGAVVEIAETEFMVRAGGYLATEADFYTIPLALHGGVAVTLGDVAHLTIGPEMRRGIAELNGEGEVAGGVVVLRSGKNARTAIAAIEQKLATLKASLPAGVEIVTTYDRSRLIDRAIGNLTEKLVAELAIVALVCIIFLGHIRSSMVAVLSLPLGILMAFAVMRQLGINANIMSLGGIAIAIGTMVDAAVVMIENAHKHVERWHLQHPGQALAGSAHWRIIADAATEVGPALFCSLLIITFSFMPVFTLEAQEGRLFGPLAFTKTFAMAAAAILAVTVIPVAMGYWIRGRLPSENANPLNRFLTSIYRPALDWTLRQPGLTLLFAALILLSALWPLSRLGGEFMPTLDEGDVLYMPSALPGFSVANVAELVQQTDRMIKTVPEVATVFGKAGRAETATDPAPLEMFETTIQFKPRDQWRPGLTPEQLIAELDRIVTVPGLTNVWVPPIRNRIDMLATGIKSPIGIKVSGDNLAAIDSAAQNIEQAARQVPGVSSAFAERLSGGRYIDVIPRRDHAARYGLNIDDVQRIVANAIGGENIGEVIDGLARFPISVRYPRELRDSIEKLRGLPVLTGNGEQITLGDVADISLSQGPSMIKSENARLAGWVYVDVRGRDLAATVAQLRTAIAREVALPVGVSVSYSGQFEYMQRANAQLRLMVPITLSIIFLLLYAIFRRFDEALLLMTTLPFALSGGIWFLYLLEFNLSVATGIGLIALAGVAAEFGVVMLLYLRRALAERALDTAMQPFSASNRVALDAAIREGALLRVRPKAMTVAVILAGLLPILLGEGTGSEIMSRIAAPMVGGMITAPLLSMLVLPTAYRLLCRARYRRQPPPAG